MFDLKYLFTYLHGMITVYGRLFCHFNISCNCFFLNSFERFKCLNFLEVKVFYLYLVHVYILKIGIIDIFKEKSVQIVCANK